jgi:hypothetical protein
MKKVEEVYKQKKEEKGLSVIVDILVKIILLTMISLLNRFRIYNYIPSLRQIYFTINDDVNVYDEVGISSGSYMIRQITEGPIQFTDNVSHSLALNILDVTITEAPVQFIDDVSHSFVGNEILIQISDTIYVIDELSLSSCDVTLIKYDGSTIPVGIYTSVVSKTNGCSVPLNIYNSITTKYDGIYNSNITV